MNTIGLNKQAYSFTGARARPTAAEEEGDADDGNTSRDEARPSTSGLRTATQPVYDSSDDSTEQEEEERGKGSPSLFHRI